MPAASGKNRKYLPPQKINHVDNSVGACRCRVCYGWKKSVARKFAQVAAYHKKELREALQKQRERLAQIAAQFTVKKDRNIHPDIPWDQMNESAKSAAHTTAQQIAAAILEAK
jgi:hypothetical protein